MKLFIGVKACLLHEGKVLIIREAPYDEGTETGKYDVPGGRIHPEETLVAGLAREAKEEVGLEIEPQNVITVQENFPVIRGEECHIVRLYYRSRYIGGEVQLGSEHDRYEWVTADTYKNYEYVPGLREILTALLCKSKRDEAK